MSKLTAAQTKALQTVADNPGAVVAWLRGENDYMKINGNTETNLFRAGLITEVYRETRVRSYGSEYRLGTWEITDAGREALGAEVPQEEAPKKEATASEGPKPGVSTKPLTPKMADTLQKIRDNGGSVRHNLRFYAELGINGHSVNALINRGILLWRGDWVTLRE